MLKQRPATQHDFDLHGRGTFPTFPALGQSRKHGRRRTFRAQHAAGKFSPFGFDLARFDTFLFVHRFLVGLRLVFRFLCFLYFLFGRGQNGVIGMGGVVLFGSLLCISYRCTPFPFPFPYFLSCFFFHLFFFLFFLPFQCSGFPLPTTHNAFLFCHLRLLLLVVLVPLFLFCFHNHTGLFLVLPAPHTSCTFWYWSHVIHVFGQSFFV